MRNSNRTVFVFILLASSFTVAGAQQPPPRVSDQMVSVTLRRLDQSSKRFRDTLNKALLQASIDETLPQNDINSFEPALESAIDRFGERFKGRLVSGADVEDLLQKASLVNGFLTRNRMNREVQNDWRSVRTSLDALANAYGASSRWDRETLPAANSNRPPLPADSDLDQLIQRIETDGDRFRSSLSDAFALTRYDQAINEANMNISVSDFKRATDQLRNRFDARQPSIGDIQRLLEQAVPIDKYMRANQLTQSSQNDWSTLRGDLNKLAGAYNLPAKWLNGANPPYVG